MFDWAIFLCCLNNYRINCLIFFCLIISIIVFALHAIGIFMIKWEIIPLYIEIIYAISIPMTFFNFFIIILLLCGLKKENLKTHNMNRTFVLLSILALIMWTFLCIIFIFSSISICKIYSNYQKKYENYFKQKLKQSKMKENLQHSSTWIIIIISTLVPSFLSIFNILLWISIYCRLYFRIECSFGKVVRKEIQNQIVRNTSFKKLEETTNITSNNKSNKGSNLISIVFEKNRHPDIISIASTKIDFPKSNKISQ